MEIEFPLQAGEDSYTSQPPADLALPAPRTDAWESFVSLDLPSPEEELWRYTDVSFLSKTKRTVPLGIFDPARYTDTETTPLLDRTGEASLGEIAALTGSNESVLSDLVPLAGVLAIRDGVPAPLVLSETLPEGALAVKSTPPREVGSSDLWFQLVSVSQDKFTSLVAALGADLYIHIPDGIVLENPLLVSVSVSESATSWVVPLHISVRLGKESKLPLIVHYSGGSDSSDETSLLLPVTEVLVGEGSKLVYVALQELAPGVCHIETTRMKLSRGAWLSSTVVALGARLSRHRVETQMGGEDAASEMLGIYFGSADQHIDFRTLQDHHAPRTISDLLYKGAVEDNAKAVYAGLVRVEKDAQKINGFQTNKNLVLSEGASAESIPNLEILANDVKCSHASSIGPIDEEEVYYLESRGIHPQVAEKLIVEGFFEEVIERIPSGMTAERIRNAVSRKFEARGGR